MVFFNIFCQPYTNNSFALTKPETLVPDPSQSNFGYAICHSNNIYPSIVLLFPENLSTFFYLLCSILFSKKEEKKDHLSEGCGGGGYLVN